MWFLGENDLRMSFYDFETKGCCDGFENYGVNRNQGAESSLSYLISHLTVLQAYEEFYQLEVANTAETERALHNGIKNEIAILSPIAWRTPPRKYGPWEQVASNIAEGSDGA